MLHVSSDEMTGGQGTAERKLAGEDGCTDDAGETAGVVTGVGGVRASDTKDVKHGALGLEDGTTAESSDLERGHRDRDLESSIEAIDVSMFPT